jgi:CRP-like cAMP-binding protein
LATPIIGAALWYWSATASARTIGSARRVRHAGAHRDSRDAEIYAEGDAANCWYKVVSGTVRVCKLLPDGRRHVAEFCFGGDCFRVDGPGKRSYSAEAVDEVIVMRYRQSTTDRLIDQNTSLARLAARCGFA